MVTTATRSRLRPRPKPVPRQGVLAFMEQPTRIVDQELRDQLEHALLRAGEVQTLIGTTKKVGARPDKLKLIAQAANLTGELLEFLLAVLGEEKPEE